jgi:hypothetical protein
MKINRATNWLTVFAACAVVLASCSGAEETPVDEPTVSFLELAIEQRGEPCACLTENNEAMSGLLESLRSTEKVSAQELNIQIAQMMLPCMKPTGNVDTDMAYSRAMGDCERFSEFVEVMKQVKTEVQTRVTEEAASDEGNGLDGAKGASQILDKLKGN